MHTCGNVQKTNLTTLFTEIVPATDLTAKQFQYYLNVLEKAYRLNISKVFLYYILSELGALLFQSGK